MVITMASQKTSKTQSSKPAGGKPAAKAGTAAAGSLEAVKEVPSQSSVFEKAMDQFHARNFKAALHEFEAAIDGPSASIAHAARVHQRMCEQRLKLELNEPKTAEDHYNLAVALINRRDLAQARVQLEAAINAAPQSDHMHYAMSLLCGLEGNMAAAAQALTRAIQLDARNRNAARNDPDFREILRHSEMRFVLESQGATPAE